MVTRVENSCLDLFKVATLEEMTVLKLTPGRFPQKNLLVSNFSICQFEIVFFYKLRKLSLFPILDNALHSSSGPRRTQLCVKVFASHTGHWYRITMRHHFKGYRQKMKEKRFFQCIVTAPLSNKVTYGMVIKFQRINDLALITKIC